MKIKSDNIIVYPVGNRTINSGTTYRAEGYLGKLNLEQNIVNQKNSLTDNNSYALTPYSTIEEISINGNVLTINSGKYCMNGYIITLTKPIKLSLTSYFNTVDYWVYFSIVE